MRAVPLALSTLLLLAATAGAQADGTLLARRECAPLQPFAQVEALARATRRPVPPAALYRRLEREVVCERLEYASDGLRVVAILVRPARPTRPMPVLIYNHGGSAAEGALPEAVLWDQARWVADGFLYLAPQYRGGGGSQGEDEYGGADVHDVVNLYPLLRTLPYADTANVFLWGHSRGGAMTYLALRAGMPVRAAAVTAGVADFTGRLRRRIPSDSARAAAERDRSALAWPERLTAPLLLMHGDADPVVPVESSRRLAERLAGLGREHALVVYPGGDHNLTGHGDDVLRRVAAWFRRHRAR